MTKALDLSLAYKVADMALADFGSSPSARCPASWSASASTVTRSPSRACA